MPEPPDLPEPGPAGCLDCKVPLYFRARTDALPAGFDCRRCGRHYRGPKEWDVTMSGVRGRDLAPPQSAEPRAPDAPAPFPLVPDYKWVGKKRRKRR